MASLTQVEERLISGKGILKVPEDYKKARLLILYLDVIRQPEQRYLNFNYNPPRGRLATLTYSRDQYVQCTDEMVYDHELRNNIADISGQNLIAIKCMYAGILQTFVNLGNALLLAPISATNLIEDYESLQLAWDEVRVVCYASTVLQLRLFAMDYDTCDPNYNDQKQPPPPPPPLPPVSPDTPVGDISPPYKGEDDGGDTVPYTGDEFPPGEGGDTGDTEPDTQYDVVYRWKQFTGGDFITQSAIVWGVVGDIRLVLAPPGSRFELWCQGVILNPFSPPPPAPSPGWYLLDSRDYATTVELELVSVTERP